MNRPSLPIKRTDSLVKKPTAAYTAVVSHSHYEGVSVDKGSPLWKHLLCSFREDDAVYYMNRYHEWFFATTRRNEEAVMKALEALENIAIEQGKVYLATDQFNRSNHATVIAGYLEWSIGQRIKKIEKEEAEAADEFFSSLQPNGQPKK